MSSEPFDREKPMEENERVESVARAIIAFLDYASPPDSRQAAFSFLESIKQGDVRVLARTSFHLVSRKWQPEVRLHGFKMLQHLVRLRWGEFNRDEQQNFATMSVNMISEMADPHEQWALRSQVAQLIAEVVRSEGFSLWKELLPLLNSICDKGPIETELIAMLLRWLPEDVTIHNEDLEGERRRLLVRGLTQSLPEIFCLLYNLLEKHFNAAVTEARRDQLNTAKQHATTVIASLNAVNAYAEWAPVPDLSKFGLIRACGFLLSSVDFRLHACEFFKIVASRKRFDGSSPEFDSAMHDICSFLTKASSDFLQRYSLCASTMDESEYEFAECLCESMANFGSHNLPSVSGDGSLLSLFLEQMLGYFQHSKLALHFPSMLFWLLLARESFSKTKAPVRVAGDDGSTDKEKKGIQIFFGDHICGMILDVSFQHMLKRNVLGGTLEIWNDKYDSKGDYGTYRGRMTELVRLVASYRPSLASMKIAQRIDSVFRSYINTSIPTKDPTLLESTQLALETVVASVFDGPYDSGDRNSPEVRQAFHMIQGSLQQLLTLNVREPTFVKLLGRHFDALGPFLKYFPDAVHSVIRNLFELLTSLPVAANDPASNSRAARLEICTSFIRIAQAAHGSLLPHMKEIADMVSYLQVEGRLLRGEHNILGEAFLIVASAAGSQAQQDVLAWLLEPISKDWTQIDWQNVYLSDPAGLVCLFADNSPMWSVFHSVTFFERALKRSGINRDNSTLQNGSEQSHPIAPHLPWILPPLLRLLHSVHSLWPQSAAQALPIAIKNAMNMRIIEQANPLGDGSSKLLKDSSSLTDVSLVGTNVQETVQINEANIRNWLKGIRESGYNVLGLSATIGDHFFRCLDCDSFVVSLMEYVQSMELWHIRQLIHLVLIPLVKFCPADLWATWVVKLLHPLFLHCDQVLRCSWTNLITEGRVCGNSSVSDLEVEVMEEQWLRSLTREICFLFSVLASPGLNACFPALEQTGHANRMDLAGQDLDAFASNSLMCFLFKHTAPNFPMLQLSLAVLCWPDGEAVNKLLPFYGAVILLAVSTNNAELQTFVAKDMFSAIIKGLTLESNAIIGAELVGLCCEIFCTLSNKDPNPKQILLSLPSIALNDLLAFEDALAKTSSPKERRQHMKSLLLLATGNHFRALAAQKGTGAITNLSAKSRSPSLAAAESSKDGDVIGLAAII